MLWIAHTLYCSLRFAWCRRGSLPGFFRINDTQLTAMLGICFWMLTLGFGAPAQATPQFILQCRTDIGKAIQIKRENRKEAALCSGFSERAEEGKWAIVFHSIFWEKHPTLFGNRNHKHEMSHIAGILAIEPIACPYLDNETYLFPTQPACFHATVTAYPLHLGNFNKYPVYNKANLPCHITVTPEFVMWVQ